MTALREGFTTGSMDAGTFKSFNKSSSHCRVWILKSIVRLALV